MFSLSAVYNAEDVLTVHDVWSPPLCFTAFCVEYLLNGNFFRLQTNFSTGCTGATNLLSWSTGRTFFFSFFLLHAGIKSLHADE